MLPPHTLKSFQFSTTFFLLHCFSPVGFKFSIALQKGGFQWLKDIDIYNQRPSQQWILLYFPETVNRCVKLVNIPLDFIFFTSVTNYIRPYLKDIQIHAILTQHGLIPETSSPRLLHGLVEGGKKPAKKDGNNS